MDINLVYGSSVTLAPAGFTSAMQYAAQQIDALISNNITVSIDINWDNSGQILGEAGPENMVNVGYAQLVTALRDNANSPAARTAADNMPATDPTNGQGVYLTEAQAEALGFISSASLPDGTATFGTDGTVLNFSTTDQAVPGEEDFVGIAEHELTHALGRIGWGNGSDYSLMDLLRFSSPGVLENHADIYTDDSPPAYFSIDDGVTNLGDFSTTSDYYDWSTSVLDDSFDAFSEEGVANTISSLDQTLMAALGFDVACFCPGTRIAVPGGERAVEALAIGDEVQTAEGLRRIKWIGRSHYEGRFLGTNPLMLPVTFAPAALGEGMPVRPLTVSPGHGVCLGGVLVPSWRLVNGVNVTRVPRDGPVSYLHIELDQHGLLLSDGAWSESYLNETPRSWFQNSAEYFALYPGEDALGPACLPRVEDGVALLALQHDVNRRAGLAPVAEGTGPLRGFVDHLEDGVCAGWAQSLDAPEAPVTLLVMRGGEILTKLVANRYRADLRAAGLGSGCHGFILAVPAGEHIITIRRALDGATLPMAPVKQAVA